MGHGYHSRSPEEFRKYLAELNSSPKTKSWRNVLIFIDVLLLLLVLYMASKKLNPSVGISLKSSAKVSMGDLQIYITKSNTPPPDSIAYFLFVANKSSKSQNFGKDILLKLSTRTETGKECLYKEFQLVDKKINPGISESFSFFFERIPESELDEECRNVYKKPAFPRTLDTFLKKKYRVDTVVYFEDKYGDKKELVLSDDNW